MAIRLNKIVSSYSKNRTARKFQYGGNMPSDYSQYNTDLAEESQYYEEGGTMTSEDIAEKAKKLLMSTNKDPNEIVSFIFELAKPALSEEDMAQLQEMYGSKEEKPTNDFVLSLFCD